jgi:glycosyltransferase involved in cell wall biosynthesis
MRICFVVTEYRGIGSYGGFGALTHDLAAGLVARGHEVYVAMPRKRGQKPIEFLNGVTVVSYPSPLYHDVGRVLSYTGLYKTIDADIYHSQEPSTLTRLAQIAEPRKKHIVTFQDPRDLADWKLEWAPRILSRRQMWRFYLKYQQTSGRAARRADVRYCQAKYTTDKVRRLYWLSERPGFLPNPVVVPNESLPKDPLPTVCFLGRWDPRKRPEIFVALAARFPDVHFIFAGASHNDPARDAQLREQCRQVENLQLPGWLDADARARILGRSWILINTSTRECLPVSYLEAAAHRCAILSHCNADEFASTFGYHAREGNLEDYVSGLAFLLEDSRWRALGEKGYEYVLNTHEYENVIGQHIAAYDRALGS